MRAPIPTGSRDVSVLRLSCYAFVLRLCATSSCYAFVLRLCATSSCYVFVLRLRATPLCYAFLLSRVPMPIHPHFRPLSVFSLADHSTATCASLAAAEFPAGPAE